MRLKQYLIEQTKFKVYVDMDGVLTDFEAQFFKFFKKKPSQIKGGDKDFWETVDKGGLEFWSDMPWLGGSKKFWNYVKQFNPTILSAPARSLPQSRQGKKIWVKRELGNTPLILKRAREKKVYANKNSILIDDMVKNVSDWNGAGGIGIRFKSPEQAIKDLKQIIMNEQSGGEGQIDTTVMSGATRNLLKPFRAFYISHDVKKKCPGKLKWSRKEGRCK